MAHPFDEGKAFLRVGVKYPHDVFGADTGGRTIPHTGIDVTPNTRGDTSVNVRSVWGGTVVETGYDMQAGWYVIIRENDGHYWGYGHNSVNLVKDGQIVAAGQPIGKLGSTGGAKGVHCHIWRAKTLAAARRIVNGYTNVKAGRDTDAWAASMALTDPLPAIEASLKAQTNQPAAEEDDMALTPQQAEALNWLGAEERRKTFDERLWQIGQLAARIGVIDRLGNAASASEIADAVASKLALPGVTAETVQAIAEAVADEQAARLRE